MVTLTFASWNPIAIWLRQVDGLSRGVPESSFPVGAHALSK
jgi:hypothetical protein